MKTDIELIRESLFALTEAVFHLRGVCECVIDLKDNRIEGATYWLNKVVEINNQMISKPTSEPTNEDKPATPNNSSSRSSL